MPADLFTLEAHYPFRHHYADVGGPRMHYVDEGDGQPILLVHGNPTWSFYYRKLILGLRDRYRVIAPDHIGCGLSEKPQRYAYNLRTHIDNLERLIEQLDLQGKITLGVHDWGGAIGMGWAGRHPELIERLVIFNTAAFLFPTAPLRIRICGWPWIGEVLVRGLNMFALPATFMALARGHKMAKDIKAGYLWPYDSWAARVAIHRFVRDIPLKPSHSSYATLASVEGGLPQFRDTPMLICWGAQDFCFHDGVLAGWITRFPQARFYRWEDAGHYVVEEAHDRILPLMEQFLQGELDTDDS